MKPKVYYYSPSPSDSTAYYRTSGVMPFLDTREKFDLVDVSEQKAFGWHNCLNCRIFIMQRPFSDIHVRILQMVKSIGVRTVIDYDDMLLHVDMYNPTHQQYQASRENILQCISVADEVWVSTQAIADSFAHPNTVVVPNAHNDYLWKLSDKKPYNPDTRKVIWRGGTSHQADVGEVANDLVKVINENPTWMFQFIGDRHTYIEQRCLDNYHIISGFPIMDFFRYYYNENSNIAIFPLCNTKFNEGKSNISWIESSYAGSAFFGNTDLPEFKREGAIHFGELETGITTNFDMLKNYNDISWQEICDTLLLSKINQLRTDRIIANL